MLAHPVFVQHFNSPIQMSMGWNKYTALYVSFPPRKHQSNIKEVKK